MILNLFDLDYKRDYVVLDLEGFPLSYVPYDEVEVALYGQANGTFHGRVHDALRRQGREFHTNLFGRPVAEALRERRTMRWFFILQGSPIVV